MYEEAEKLEQAIKNSQKHARKLASVAVPHGLKKAQKQFWEKDYVDIQVAAVSLIQTVANYTEPAYVMPFPGEAFKKAWHYYTMHFHQKTGFALYHAREKTQLELLGQYAQSEGEAIRMLNHFINRGEIHIYKVNFEDKTPEKPGKQKNNGQGTNYSNEDYE